ncbi:MAG TPA: hypothetical protein VK154_03475 [Chitinophagales bacterium]|nr:hypothetical protein [Chitinophagales bacterium]
MKRLSFTLFLSLFYFCCFAGYDLLFCTKADSLGNCKGKGETFAWKDDKTSLELIVMNKDSIGLPKLKFKLYAMKNDREGELYAELSLYLNPRSLFGVKKMRFYKPGYYKVEVLDDKDGILTTGFVTLSDREE